VLLRETLWEIFSSTGNIDAYLAYRACLDCCMDPSESADETTEQVTVRELFAKNMLSEVRWH
jgi:hypothetical protein